MIRTITCIGAGFVGGPLAAVLAYSCPHIQVIAVDKNKDRIDGWNSNKLPIYEPGLQEIIQDIRQRKGACNLVFSTDIHAAIDLGEMIMLCIDTPTKKGGTGQGMALDLAHTQAAVRTIASVARSDKIVVEKSTVPCGTAEVLRDLLISSSRNNCQFEVLSNPEFLSEGTTIPDLLHPSRVLIGCQKTPPGYQAAEKLAEVYRSWIPADQIITMDQWSSELSKLAANAMLAQRISSINSLSAICEAVGANIDSVAQGCGTDHRIGNEMLQSTLGWGGGCFPKDVSALVYLARSLGLDRVANYWAAVLDVNEDQKSRFFRRIVNTMHGSISGKTIAVFGFAFKKNTFDTKCSPAINLVQDLLTEGARVSVYDPMVPETQIRTDVGASKGSGYLQVHPTAYDACAGADAVILATDWAEFGTPRSDTQMNGTAHQTVDWHRIADGMQAPRYIFDGRRMLDGRYLQGLGCRYICVGHASPWDIRH